MEIHQSNRKIEWLVWGAIVATVLVVAAFFVRSQIEQHRESQAGWPERSRAIDLRPIAQLPEVTLTNQDSRPVSLADLRGQVWVADIIFTQCAGPCPVMTQRMSELQKVLPAPVKLVTLTTDPEHDRPEVLKRFGEHFKADFNRWNFLTGSKEAIARAAVDGMKLTAIEKNPAERESERDLFIHSILFVLVDKQGRLRGSIESSDP